MRITKLNETESIVACIHATLADYYQVLSKGELIQDTSNYTHFRMPHSTKQFCKEDILVQEL